MNKRIQHILIILMVTMSLAPAIKAQQAPVYSKYFMSRFLINPARAGAYGYTTVDLTAREQWLGFAKNTPGTYALSFQTRLMKQSYMGGRRSVRRRSGGRFQGGRVGLGGYIFNDRSGLLNYNGLLMAYAYHISIQKSQLSFGVSGSILQFSLDDDAMIKYHEADQLLDNSKHRLYSPDVSIGTYYTYPNFYAGVSVTQLTQSVFKFGTTGFENSDLKRYYYGLSGYRYDIDRYWSVEPSILIKTNETLHSQFDINVRGFYIDDYWAGLSYRTGGKRLDDSRNGGSAVIMLGVRVDMLHFGYAFDYSFNNLQKYGLGSHEINIAVLFGDNARRYRWLDRY